MPPRLSVAVLTTVLAAGCAASAPVAECSDDTRCPARSRCVSRVCVAGMAPNAFVAPLGTVEAFSLVQVDGSASTDADDDLIEYVWSTRAITASCAPPEVASRTERAPVRFACPGRFEVALTVRDALGLESTTRVETVVVPSTKPSVIRIEHGDVATDHVCTRTPPGCRTSDPVRLTATTTQGFRVRWSVTPPRTRAPAAAAAVRFVPDPAVADPAVVISTAGSAISGDYVFQVDAVDSYGVVGTATVRVTVRNRPPALVLAKPAPFPHAFDAARSVFTASGVLPWSVTDPDGDVVTVRASARHAGDGSDASFDVELADTLRFSVVVPYASPVDALRLRGGSGLTRTVELVADDGNGGIAREEVEVPIGNRPPISAGGTFATDAPHWFDPARSVYVATLSAGTYADPDGDPLFGGTTNARPCGTVHMKGNEATLECTAPYVNVFSLATFAGPGTYTVTVRDPWDAFVEPAHELWIWNSAPTITAFPEPGAVCVSSTATSVFVPATTFISRPHIADPDGDPLKVTPYKALDGSVTPGATVCAGTGCPAFQFFEPSLTWYSGTWNARSTLNVTDGVFSANQDVSPRWDLRVSCP